MTTHNIDLDDLEAKLASTAGMTNSGQAERDRDYAKTGALLSIARSLEANKVPDHWESLEGPSGAILGWFDPQVARAIAQALGATQTRQDGETEAEPVEVGSLVVLTKMAEQAEAMGDTTTVGEVTELGESEGTAWAWVVWGTEVDGSVDEGKVWVSELTVVGRAGDELAEAVAWQPTPGDRVAHGALEGIIVELADKLGEPAALVRYDDGSEGLTHLVALEPLELGDRREVAGVTSDGTIIEPDDEPAPAPEPEVDDDDIDADFDTVVETAPAPDGLAAIRKGKSKGGK